MFNTQPPAHVPRRPRCPCSHSNVQRRTRSQTQGSSAQTNGTLNSPPEGADWRAEETVGRANGTREGVNGALGGRAAGTDGNEKPVNPLLCSCIVLAAVGLMIPTAEFVSRVLLTRGRASHAL